MLSRRLCPKALPHGFEQNDGGQRANYFHVVLDLELLEVSRISCSTLETARILHRSRLLAKGCRHKIVRPSELIYMGPIATTK